ncbi:MAG TPA: hypothetical protein VIL37_17500 [Natronosporangium sp.]
MRGIAGYVGLDAELAETVLRRMARQVGCADEPVAMHRGIGLVAPIRSADGRYLMAYEGELYNEAELLDALAPIEATGGPALMLAAWARSGAAVLDHCNGRFALAILDTSTGEVTLARDPIGHAPLYFAADGSGRVAFASELRAILAAGVVPRRPDDPTIYRYLALGVHDDTERTFFDRVTRLQPGELVVISPTGELRRETYTGLFRELDHLATGHRSAGAGDRAPSAVGDQVAAAIGAAIERRMVSDAPAGASLAGTPDLDRLADDLPDLLDCQQQPVGSIAGYADYCLMREASRQVSVLVDRSAASELVLEQLRQTGQPPLRLRLRRRSIVPPAELLGPGFPDDARAAPAGPGGRSAEQLLRRRLPGLLRCQDRNGARFGVRRREPYLDPYLLRVLWRLDPAALRAVTADLPPAPATTPPPDRWPAPLAALAGELFGSERFAARPYVDAQAVRRAYRAGELDPAFGWRLVNVELWLRGLVDRDPTLPPAATFVAHYARPVVTAPADPPVRPAGGDLITVDAGG